MAKVLNESILEKVRKANKDKPYMTAKEWVATMNCAYFAILPYLRKEGINPVSESARRIRYQEKHIEKCSLLLSIPWNKTNIDKLFA